MTDVSIGKDSTPKSIKKIFYDPKWHTTSILTEVLCILVIFALIFGGFWFGFDLIVPFIPRSVETKMSLLFDKIPEYNNPVFISKINHIYNAFHEIEPMDYELKIFPVDRPEINAYACLGGTIYITRGLLLTIDSDDELAFVIAHEIGHINNRDHLRLLGRTCLLAILSNYILGEQNVFSSFLMTRVNLNFSKVQETQADLYAVKLIKKSNFNIEKSLNFLKKLSENQHNKLFTALFSTHPHPEQRIDNITKFTSQK